MLTDNLRTIIKECNYNKQNANMANINKDLNNYN